MSYLLVALLCLILPQRSQRRFWWVIALLIAVLGASNLARFPQFVTNAGRQAAYMYGWYDQRRSLQALGIIGLLLGGAALVLGLRVLFRHRSPPESLAVLAASGLFTLSAVRAVSLHAIDRLLGLYVFGAKLSWLAEMLGLLCIVGALVWARRQEPATAHTAPTA